MYIIIVYLSPPLVSTFYACLTLISRCVPGESKTENCIFDQCLPALTGHLTPVIPSMCIDFHCVLCARATVSILLYISLYPLNVPGMGDVTRKFNRGLRRVAPHGTTQPYFVRLQELHTIHYLSTLCYWTINFTFFKWSLSVQFNSSTPMLGWQ